MYVLYTDKYAHNDAVQTLNNEDNLPFNVINYQNSY